MSNWALELQQFNIDRIWIRGEANILADAPSRAPWETRLAQFLPIPDMPVRDLVVKFYQAPDEVQDLVSRRRKELTGDEEWVPLDSSVEVPQGPMLDQARQQDATPDFGSGPGTPNFGDGCQLAKEVIRAFGSGRVVEEVGPSWPRFPALNLSEPIREAMRVGTELSRAFPTSPIPCPAIALEI